MYPRNEFHDPTPSRPSITIAWLTRLRWGASLLQALTLAVSTIAVKLPLPIGPLAFVVFLTVATNGALEVARRRSLPASVVPAIFLTDTLLLTALLYFAGGPANPFSVLYLVHVTLAALVLGMGWAWAMVALSSACYGALFFAHVHVHALGHEHGTEFSLHLHGMWAAFTLAAAMIAFFVARVAAALRKREEELRDARDVAARMEKLASLTTLAAGAAHELGTPLGTIAIAAGELARAIESMPETQALREDAKLIRDQLERCRTILDRMSEQAGSTAGEPASRITLHSFLNDLPRIFARDASRIRIDATCEATVIAPKNALERSVVNLIQNALDAGPQLVQISLKIAANRVQLRVADVGCGIPSSILPHVGEPFFTTKLLGKGMGLGVFLAQTLAVQLGGSLAIESTVGAGTTAILDLPKAE